MSDDPFSEWTRDERDRLNALAGVGDAILSAGYQILTPEAVMEMMKEAKSKLGTYIISFEGDVRDARLARGVQLRQFSVDTLDVALRLARDRESGIYRDFRSHEMSMLRDGVMGVNEVILRVVRILFRDRERAVRDGADPESIEVVYLGELFGINVIADTEGEGIERLAAK